MIKCDESMRRSKERCYIPFGRRWRCTTNCKECICAMFKQEDGTWIHKKLDRHKGHYVKVGEKYDEFESEGREV